MKTGVTALAALVFTSTFTLAQDATGSWTKKANKIEGAWKTADGKVNLYSLSTKSALDLKIFLSPKTVGELTIISALAGSKRVAKFAAPKGNQTYDLPAGIDLTSTKA